MECSVFYNKNEHEHIQKKTFTKWINNLLSKKHPEEKIQNLYVDLCDGIRLLELLQILTKQKLTIEKRKHMQRVHCLANMCSLIGFLKDTMHIKLINIHAADIVDGRPNIILGLVWQIILNFQIKSENMFKLIAQRDSNPTRRENLVKGNPREALLAWSDKVITENYGISINDFHSSWKDGKAFNAIIHNINPNLVDWDLIKRRNSRENLEYAFRLAEKYLNIPKLLEPEDVDVDYPDEKSIMTYLSLFLHNYPDQDIHKNSAPKASHNWIDIKTSEETAMDKISQEEIVKQRSSLKKSEFNKYTTPTLQSTMTIKRQNQPKPVVNPSVVRQIKNDKKSEEEENKAFNDEFQSLRYQIKTILLEIDSDLKDPQKYKIDSVEENMKSIVPVVEKINQLKELQERLENLDSRLGINIEEKSNKIKSLNKDFQERFRNLLNIQWEIESDIDESEPLSNYLNNLRMLEQGLFFVTDLTVTDVEYCNLSYISQIKAALDKFSVNRFQIFQNPPSRVPRIYVDSIKSRINIISDKCPELSAYFELFGLFRAATDKHLELQNKIKFLKSGFESFQILVDKYEELKSLVHGEDTESLKVHLKQISESSSKIVKGFISKDISRQMILNQTNQKINDVVKSTLKEIEDILSNQNSLLNKWKKYNEKKDDLIKWISQAKSALKLDKSKRDEFFAANFKLNYQSFVEEKNHFSSSDPDCIRFIENEFEMINESWNSIVKEIELKRQFENIFTLKKEYNERIERIENWMSKSETIADRKATCERAELEENLDILEAAAKNFETVKIDLQKAAKIGESMFKSNLMESDTEEILGKLQIHKDRFVIVRDKINKKLKILKKLILVMTVFRRNSAELNKWLESAENNLLCNFETGNDEDFHDWISEHEKCFEGNYHLVLDGKINENAKILQRILEQVEEDVDTKLIEDEMENLTERVQICFKNSLGIRNQKEFEHFRDKLKKLLNETRNQIMEEETQLNLNKDFSQVLFMHENYFDNGKIQTKCNELLNSLKLVNIHLINGGKGSLPVDYHNERNNMEYEVDLVFERVATIHSSLLTIPHMLKEFDNLLLNLVDWTSKVEDLSSQLEIYDPMSHHDSTDCNNSIDIENNITFEEYNKTLTEFQRLYDFTETHLKDGEHLTKLLSDIQKASPYLSLEDEKLNLDMALSKCNEIEPKISNTQKIAPIIAESIAFKAKQMKVKKRLLQIKMDLEKIEEEEICEIENIYEKEQILQQTFAVETPNIIREIEKEQKIVADFETINLKPVLSKVLEEEWKMLNELKEEKLEKLKEAKEMLVEIESNSNNLQADIANFEGELKLLKEEIPAQFDFDGSVEKLKGFLENFEDKIDNKVFHYESSVNEAHKTLHLGKDIELDKERVKLKSIINSIKESASKEINNLHLKKEIINKSNQINEEFKGFLENINTRINRIKETLNLNVDKNLIEELSLIEKELKAKLMKSKYSLLDLLKTDDLEEDSIFEKVNQIVEKIMKDSKDSEDIVHTLQKNILIYHENFNKILERQQNLGERTKLLLENVKGFKSFNFTVVQWESLNRKNILNPFQNELKILQTEIHEKLEREVLNLHPPNQAVLFNFDSLISDLKFIGNLINEENENIENGSNFLSKNRDIQIGFAQSIKSISDHFSECRLDRMSTFEKQIFNLENIKDGIIEALQFNENQQMKIDQENITFNPSTLNQMKSEIINNANHLQRNLDECIELIDSRQTQRHSMDNILDQLLQQVKEIENFETFVKDLKIIFGESSIIENQLIQIKNDLNSINKPKIEKLSKSIDSLLKLTKDENLVQSKNQVKDLQTKLESIERQVNENFDFNKWSESVYRFFSEIITELENNNKNFLQISESNIRNSKQNLVHLNKKIDELKKFLKSRKTFLKLHDKNTEEIVDLFEKLGNLEKEVKNLSERMAKEEKLFDKANRNWKEFEQKKKALEAAIDKNVLKINSMTVKYLTVPGLQFLDKELEGIEHSTIELNSELDCLQATIERLYEGKTVKCQQPENCLDSILRNYKDLSMILSEKRNSFNFLSHNVSEIESCWLRISNLIKNSKDAFKPKTPFSSLYEMEMFFENSKQNFQNTKELLDKNLNSLEEGLDNLKQITYCDMKAFNSISTNQNRVKGEVESFSCLMNQFMEKFFIELKRFQDLNEKVIKLTNETNSLYENLHTISNGRSFSETTQSSIDDEEERLNSLQNYQLTIKDLLKESFQFCSIKPFQDQLNVSINTSKDCQNIIQLLKEKRKKIEKEKENISTNVQLLSMNLNKISNNLQNNSLYHWNDDCSQLGEVKNYEENLHLISNDLENYQKLSKNLFLQCEDKELENLISKITDLMEKATGVGANVDLVKRDINRRISQNFNLAKDEHERWISSTVSKINASKSPSQFPKDIASDLQTVNELISSLDTGEKLVEETIIQSRAYRQLDSGNTTIGVEREDADKRSLRERFQSIVSEIFLQKSDLEVALNEVNKQQDSLHSIGTAVDNNRKRFSAVTKPAVSDVESKHVNLKFMETIQLANNDDIERLTRIKSETKDISVKNNANELERVLKEFDFDIQDKTSRLLKDIKLHESLLFDLRLIEGETRAKTDQIHAIKSTLLVDSIYIMNLKKKFQELENFTENILSRQNTCVKNCESISIEGVFPNDIVEHIKAVQINIQHLNKQMSVIDQECQSCEKNFDEWNKIYTESKDLMNQIECAIEEESRASENLIEKEQKYNLALSNKDRLESYKINILNLESIANHLKGNQYRVQIDEIKNRYKQAIKHNSNNISLLNKYYQRHRNYISKITDINNSFSFFAIDNCEEIHSKSLKNSMKKLKTLKAKLIEINSEIKKLKSEKDILAKETTERGKEILDKEFLELNDKLMKLNSNCDGEIERINSQSISLDNAKKLLKQIKNWLIERKRLLNPFAAWNVDDGISARKLNEIQTLMLEFDPKLNQLLEIDNVCNFSFIEANELIFNKNELQIEFSEMKRTMEKLFADGKEIQQLTCQCKEQLKSLKESQENIKSKLNRSEIISKLENEMEYFLNLSRTVDEFDESINRPREILRTLSQFELTSEIFKGLSMDLEKIETNHRFHRDQIKSKMESLNEKQKIVELFKAQMKVVSKSMDTVLLMCNSIGEKETPTGKLEKLEEILNKILDIKPDIDGLKSLAVDSGYSTYLDSANNMVQQYDRLLQNIRKDESVCQDQQEICDRYVHSLDQIVAEMDANSFIISDLCSKGFNDIENVSKSKLKAEEIRKLISKNQDQLLRLNQSFEKKNNPFLATLNKDESSQSLSVKMNKNHQMLNEYIDKCNEELDLVSQYTKKSEELETLINFINLNLINIERSGDFSETNLNKIKDLKSSAIVSESLLEELKNISDSSNLLKRRSNLKVDHNKCDSRLIEIKDQSSRLYSKLTRQIAAMESLEKLNQNFSEKVQELHERINKSNGKILNTGLVNTLGKTHQDLSSIQEKLGEILKNDIDKHNDRYLELTGSHRNRTKQIQMLEKDLFECQRKLNHQIESMSKFNSHKTLIEDSIKNLEIKFQSLTNPDDFVFLQTNETCLRTLLFHCEEIELKLNDLRNESLDNKISNYSTNLVDFSHQFNTKLDLIKNEIQVELKSYKMAIDELKEHQYIIQSVKQFLHQSQQKLTNISISSDNIHQLEHELQKIQDLHDSFNKNYFLIVDCSKLDTSKLRCLSDKAIETFQQEIDQINHFFQQLKESIENTKDILVKKLKDIKEKVKREDRFKLWLKKEERTLKINDHIFSEHEIDGEIQRLHGILTELVTKQNEVSFVSSTSEGIPEIINPDIKELCENFSDNAKKRIVLLEKLSKDFDVFNKLLKTWTNWYENIAVKRKQMLSMPDSSGRDFVKYLLNEKTHYFDLILSIASNGESFLPYLTAEGRDVVKSTMKRMKEQWHEIFDDLLTLLERFEEKIKKLESFNENYENCRKQFETINLSLIQEIETREPVKLNFPIGIENKERQLQRLCEFKQNLNALNNSIQRLEYILESDIDGILTAEVNALVIEFHLSKEIVDKAKEISLKSYQNHQTFEASYLQVQDYVAMMNKNVSICKTLDGTTNSIEARMERIQTVLMKELMDMEHQANHVINQLTRSFNSVLSTSCVVEQKIFRERFETIIKEKKMSDDLLKSTRTILEMAYKNLEKFKTKFGSLSSEVSNLTKEIQSIDDCEILVIEKLTDATKSLSKSYKDLHDEALEIFQATKNQYPLEMCKSIENQLEKCSRMLEKNRWKLDQLSVLRNQFDVEEKDFSDILNSSLSKFSSTQYQFDLCGDLKDFSIVATNLSEIEVQIRDSESSIESLKLLFHEIGRQFPNYSKKIVNNFSSLKQNYEKFLRDFNGFKTHFQSIFGASNEINERLAEFKSEFDLIDLSQFHFVPDEKVKKFKNVNDLNTLKMHLISIIGEINEVDIRSISHQKIKEKFEKIKTTQLKSFEELMFDADCRLKTVNDVLINQEQLENFIVSSKESLNSIEYSKDRIVVDFSVDKTHFDEKMKEIDANLSSLQVIKRSIEENLSNKVPGCLSEIGELKTLEKEREKLKVDLVEFKKRLSSDFEYFMALEDRIGNTRKRMNDQNEEILDLNENGMSIEDKRSRLDKAFSLKKKISEIAIEIDDIKEILSTKTSDPIFNETLIRTIKGLETQNKEQLEKTEKIIKHQSLSVEVEEKFESLYQDLIKELRKVKCLFSNFDSNQTDPFDLPTLDDLQDSILILNDLGRESKLYSSASWKENIAKKLGHIDENWKKLESTQIQLTKKIEQINLKIVESKTQRKNLIESLESLKENSTTFLTDKPFTVVKIQHKIFQLKNIQSQLKEWRKEMDSMKDSKSVDNGNELMKKFRKIQDEIHFEILETKLALEFLLDFDKEIDDFTSWSLTMENRILVVPRFDSSADQIGLRLKDGDSILSQLSDGRNKVLHIKAISENLLSHLSKEGQGFIQETLTRVSDNYQHLQETLKDKLKTLELEKTRFEEYESKFKEFLNWLVSYENLYNTKVSSSSLEDKQTSLAQFQSNLQNIFEHKSNLNELIEKGAKFPLNFSIKYNTKDIQIRYPILLKSAQNRIEYLAKSVENHEIYEKDKSTFQTFCQKFNYELKSLKEEKMEIGNLKEIFAKLTAMDIEIRKMEQSRSALEVGFNVVLVETSEIGKKELSSQHLGLLKSFEKFLIDYDEFKSLISKEKKTENNFIKQLEHFSIGLESLIQTMLNLNPSSQIHISSLQNCHEGLEKFSEELKRRSSSFDQLITNYDINKSEIVSDLITTIDTELKSASNSLAEKRAHVNLLLETNQAYQEYFDRLSNWLSNTYSRIQESSDLYGPQSVISQRSDNLNRIQLSIQTEGETLLKAVIERADELNRIILDRTNKEKLSDQVSKCQGEFYNVSNKLENIKTKVNDLETQWKNFDTNIKLLNKVNKVFANRKERFRNMKYSYFLNINAEIEKILDLVKDIEEEKSNLEIFSNQIQSLIDVSQEAQLDTIYQDLIDQIDGHEIDCKSLLDMMRQMGNEKSAFDQQVQNTQLMIDAMKAQLLPIDQLHNIASFNDYQKIFREFQLLESKLIDGDRMVDECFQMFYKLSVLFDSEKALNDMISLLKKNWDGHKEKFDEVKTRMNRLLNLWSNLENLRIPIEEWIQTTEKEMEAITCEGYQSTDANLKAFLRVKARKNESETIKPKLSKFIELFYKADIYPGFSKTKDPLVLQKVFCENLDKLMKLEKSLSTTQLNVEKLLREISDAEKWVIEMCLLITSEQQKIPFANSLLDLKDRAKLCKNLKIQIENFGECTIGLLNKNFQDISRLFIKPSPLKNDIFGKLTSLDQGMKQMASLTDKLKASIKDRSSNIKRFGSIIESVEIFLYRKFPEWWIGKEVVATINPGDCLSQLSDVSAILENVQVLEADFEQVWQDNIRQLHSISPAHSHNDGRDTFFNDSTSYINSEFTSLDDHLDRVKRDLKQTKDCIERRLEDLQGHSHEWNQIESEISELTTVFIHQKMNLKQTFANLTNDDILYERFEKSLIELIEKKDIVDKLDQRIKRLNVYRDHESWKYGKYSLLNEIYSDLLNEMVAVRKSLRAMDVHDLCQEIMAGEDMNDFSQNVSKQDISLMYPQIGTQTNRNKATSIQTIKRFSSNPNLRSFSSGKPSQNERDSSDSGPVFSRTSPCFAQKLVQTVNDIGTQHSRPSKSHKKSINTSNEYEKILTKEQKDRQFKRLNELLETVRQIKEQISLSNSSMSIRSNRSQQMKSNNSLRNSTESIRHNLLQPKNKRKKSPQKNNQMRSSVESLGKRPSPTGCTTPISFHRESPRKMRSSPRKSPAKRNSKIAQFAN